MTGIALKIDVDTYRGTREGALRLADLLERLDIRATFLFSLGPDHTGRAVKRAFRRGFIGKVRRTSVVAHYGLRTLMYGVVLPGPHIGRKCREVMRDIARRGFEVGVHTYDHVKWQDGVRHSDRSWALREMQLAQAEFTEIFGRPAEVHGAAGWQINDWVSELEQQLGFRYASDTRGTTAFMPRIGGREIPVPQLPTTLATLDELIGRVEPVEHLLESTRRLDSDQVFTLHAEIEGGRYIDLFESLLRRWRQQGLALHDLRSAFLALDPSKLPRCEIIEAEIEGRSGTLAMQGHSLDAGPRSA